jgi:flagellar basal body rod protein FlgG
MDPSLAAAASGMEAADTMMGVAAGNIANEATPGYQEQQATLSAVPGGGVAVSSVGPSGAGADLGEEMVQLLTASTMYDANARAFARIAGTLASSFDVLA